MQEKLFRKLKIVFLIIAVAIFAAITLSSCTIFDPLFDKGDDEVVYLPKADAYSAPRLERVASDYTDYTTNQPAVYTDADGTVAMAAKTGDTVYIVIDYINKSELSINSVVIDDSDGNSKTYKSSDFSANSTATQTRIPITITDTAEATRTYKVSKVYYNYKSQINQMTLEWESAQPMTLNINPKFTLKIDNRNDTSIVTKNLSYRAALSDYLAPVTNRMDDLDAPKKVGSWLFVGYFTRPNGMGIQVKDSDNFFFWQDTTLYAHYERLFLFTTMTAEAYGIEPIKDETVDPVTNQVTTKTYNYVAVINKKSNKGDLQVNLTIEDTIIDDSGRECAVVEIAFSAFANTKSLSVLTLGKYVTTIGNGAFSGSNVRQIVFPAGGRLTTLGNRAFENTTDLARTQLTALTLPDTVKYLGDKCFYGSSWAYMRAKGDTIARRTMTIYPEIEHIGDWCFGGTGFEAVEVAPGTKFKADAVKGQAYSENTKSDYYLGWCLFKSCESIVRFVTRTTDGQADGLEFISPGMFDLLSANSKPNVGLTTVQLGEGLKKIGRGAFHYQKLLTAIVFPNSLEDICSENAVNGPSEAFTGEGTKDERSEFGAFQNCLALKTVTFQTGSKLKVLGCHAFANNRVLESIRITSMVFEQFGDAPFEGSSMLTEVYFDFDGSIKTPTPIAPYKRGMVSLRKPGADFFYPSMSFKVFVKQEVIESFQESLVQYTSTTARVNSQILAVEMIHSIKDSNGKEIGRMAIKDIITYGNRGWELGYFFTNEKEVVVPDEYDGTFIIAIGAYAFPRTVEVVSIPQYTLVIGDNAFRDCTSLRRVHFGNVLTQGVNSEMGRANLREIGETAFMNTKLQFFISGARLDTIRLEAFYGCSGLEFVDLSQSQSLVSVGTGVFNLCRNLVYCRLPVNLRSISDSMFAENRSLQYLVLMIENPSSTGLFANATSSYFSGVSSGVITTYAASELAREAIMACQYLPSQLRGGIIYNSASPSPGPDEIVPGFTCDDIMYFS